MMHKCIIVTIGGSKKRKLSKKSKFCGNKGDMYKFCRNKVEFINFVEIGECNMHNWLRGMDAPEKDNRKIEYDVAGLDENERL